MQLVAYGAQDIYLTGNPQITFFKAIYRRHTNFAMEAIEQSFDGTANFGRKVSSIISRNGDLIHRMYIEHSSRIKHNRAGTVNHHLLGHVEHYGHSLIKDCTIEIGGQQIDKHTSMWYRVWSDLTEKNPSGYFGQSNDLSKDVSSDRAEGNGTLYQNMTSNGLGLNTANLTTASTYNNFNANDKTINNIHYTNGSISGDNISSITVNKTFLPLQFWFNRNPGLALPLIALQYHEVKIIINFESISNLIRIANTGSFGEKYTGSNYSFSVIESNGGDLNNGVDITDKVFKLWVDYIYLDTDERRRFAQVSHEYLIEQLQYEEFKVSSPNKNLKLNFNHPVKEIIWTTRNETVSNGVGIGGRNQVYPTATDNVYGDYTSSPGVSLDEMGGKFNLKLNGQERFAKRDSRYFTRTQVWQHHTGYGATPTFGKRIAKLNVSGVYGFATKQGNDSIAVYSFALKPEDHQPSGTCNFSRIDNAQLCIENFQVFTLNKTGIRLGDDTDMVGDSGDLTGASVSLSSDGNRVAVGAYTRNSNTGVVRIYDYNSSTGHWNQVGGNLDGKDTNEYQGISVSLSSDGSRVATGAWQHNSGSETHNGVVRVYEYNGSSWDQLGDDSEMVGSEGDRQGISVSLSSDGNRVATGGYLHDSSGGTHNGIVRVYDYNGSWVQVGNDMVGLDGDRQGHSVSLSPDGSRVATGGDFHNSDGGTQNGIVRVYNYNSSTGIWNQLGDDSDMVGKDNDLQGFRVSLSSNGNRVATGAHYHSSGSETNNGIVRVYDYNSSTGHWNQVGNDSHMVGLDGELQGHSVSLSPDGSRVATGTIHYSSDKGTVRIYDYNGSSWIQLGDDSDLDGLDGDRQGQSVSLSSDGNLVAIGAFEHFTDGGIYNGIVRVYDLSFYSDTKPELLDVGGIGCDNIKVTVFATNYNVLRIMSGMAGLAYSN